MKIIIDENGELIKARHMAEFLKRRFVAVQAGFAVLDCNEEQKEYQKQVFKFLHESVMTADAIMKKIDSVLGDG
jgi:GTP-binding protein EngB required for normal cell division